MLKNLTLLGILLGFGSAWAINPDFYKHQKIKKSLEKQRVKGAQRKTRERKKEKRQKVSHAKSFTKVRKSLIRAREKRETLFEKDLAEKEKFRARKIEQANRYAKKRRKKSKVSWQEQNLEYGIQVPEKKVESSKK